LFSRGISMAFIQASIIGEDFGEEGEGFKITMSAFDHGLYTVASGAMSIIRAYKDTKKARKNKMLDYQSVREKKATVQDLVKGLNKDDLRRELNEVYNDIEHRIANAGDAEVIFQPVDPNAKDPFAKEGEAELAWTLGHVIVHLTASMEEAASISQELARGVEFHGRSRWEVPFREVKTIAFCRARLAESLRMCSAALDMWPDPPHMDNTYVMMPGALPHTPVSRFASGLKHASDHLEQISEIIRQAKDT